MNDLTIVILSRGREAILRSTLNFYGSKHLSVLVVHNSDKPLNPADIPSNAKYIVARDSYAKRCGIAAENIESKFAVLSSDDEFLLPSTLFRMCSELENSPKAASISGRVIAIRKYGPQILASEIYKAHSSYVNKSENQIKRLQAHLEFQLVDYKIGLLYRLTRSENLIRILKTFSMLEEVQTPYIYEVIGELGMVISGELINYEEFYWIRNWIEPPVSHTHWNRKIHFGDWLHNSSFGEVHHVLFKVVHENLWPSSTPDQISKVLEEFADHRVAIETQHRKRRALPGGSYVKFYVRRFLRRSLTNDLNSIFESCRPETRQELEQAIQIMTKNSLL
jgi:glycosyltransferase domain-containing protein